jgi:hypothetical protein
MCICCNVSLCVARVNGFGFDAGYGYVAPPRTPRLPYMLWGPLTFLPREYDGAVALVDRCTARTDT